MKGHLRVDTCAGPAQEELAPGRPRARGPPPAAQQQGTSLAGGRPWAGPPAPRVAVQVGTMTLSRHASFSHSNFGAAGQGAVSSMLGWIQQPRPP